MGRRELHPPIAQPVPVAQPKSDWSGGQSLAPDLRAPYETAFGRDFGHVRVHDDARAHDAARGMDARAFTQGSDVVFGAGQYQPASGAGRGLLAHELAHVVQQAPAPQTAPLADLSPGADRALEAEAEASAGAFATGRAMPGLTRLSAPAVQRQPVGVAPPPAAGNATTPVSTNAAVATSGGPAQNLPTGMAALKDEPAGLGTDELRVKVDNFQLPAEKGIGSWVQDAYDLKAGGDGPVFTPIIAGASISAFKEGAEDYSSIWANNFGFADPKAVGKAITTAAKLPGEVKDAWDTNADFKAKAYNLQFGLLKASCDIDHIVEKQLGGTSIPSNLQILDASKNRTSGTKTFDELKGLVAQIRDPAMRGPKVTRLQLVIAHATAASATPDGSHVIEKFLRDKKIKGDETVKTAGAGKPVTLMAGGAAETVPIKDAGETVIDAMAKRLIPGMRLKKYARSGDTAKPDKVTAELDARAMTKSNTKVSEVHLDATVGAPTTPAAATPNPAAPVAAPTAAPAAAAPAGEQRALTFAAGGKTPDTLPFYYPYLSPGELKGLTLDAGGKVTGTGTIDTKVPILGPLNVLWQAQGETDSLTLDKPIDAAQLKPNNSFFRFTSGSLGLQLSPNLVPSGNLNFTVGPAAKPVVLGTFVAKFEGGALTASGTLTPGGTIPGIKAAAGTVTWSSETGWAGALSATTSSFGDFSIDAVLGFKTANGDIAPYGTGGLHGTIRGNPVGLSVQWTKEKVIYRGDLTLKEPIKGLVSSATVSGTYDGTTLTMSTPSPIVVTWRGQSAQVSVTYVQAEGAPPSLTGKLGVDVKLGKATGRLDLGVDEQGNVWGGGKIAYQFTDKLKPEIDAKIDKAGKVQVSGSVKVDDIELSPAWPKGGNGTYTLIKDKEAKFSVPLPAPLVGLQAFAAIGGSAGFNYGLGPAMLKNATFTASFFPFETDMQLTASLDGLFDVPGHVGFDTEVHVVLGVEVVGGLLGVDGGLSVEMGVKLSAGVSNALKMTYSDKDGFSFKDTFFAHGKLEATGKVSLIAEVYLLDKWIKYDWRHPVAEGTVQIGPEVKLIMGEIGYDKAGGFKWPSTDDIRLEPDVSLKDALLGLFSDSKTTQNGQPPEKYRQRMFDPGKI